MKTQHHLQTIKEIILIAVRVFIMDNLHQNLRHVIVEDAEVIAQIHIKK